MTTLKIIYQEYKGGGLFHVIKEGIIFIIERILRKIVPLLKMIIN